MTMPRPCPYLDCRYHLCHEERSARGPATTRPTMEWYEMRETCALDVADDGPHTLLEIGDLLGVTRERIRQIEISAKEHMRQQGRPQVLRELEEALR